MNSPKPALVTHRGARRMPRWGLLLLCASYVLPGLFGREPWRGAELVAYGQMSALAEGRSSWWAPSLGGLPADGALLSTGLGAVFIKLGGGWLDPVLAARIPFALLLALTLALVWYATLHLALTEAAQPVPFAFGGEAQPMDYARAMADGAVLALMAALGLLLLGHETTPELLQLAATSLWLYGLACAPTRLWRSRGVLLFALPLLAGAGAPSMAMAMGAGALLVCGWSRLAQVRALVPWLAAACAAAALTAIVLDAWKLRTTVLDWASARSIARQWLWFMWPLWPMALWTLWRWRRQLSYRHLSVPLSVLLVALAANLAMGGFDRALLLGLPALAILAAFALPTLKRSATAAVDWFSMLFFTIVALWFWLVYVALQTGVPGWQARNVFKLLPGFEPRFSLLELVAAVVGTVAWVFLVRWRTGRHREALWKSLVLPAGGVALCWLLAMSLWLQPLDYARSARPWVKAVVASLPTNGCIEAPDLTPSLVAALEALGQRSVHATTASPRPNCEYRLQVVKRQQQTLVLPGWTLLAQARRPTDREEITLIYRRNAGS